MEAPNYNQMFVFHTKRLKIFYTLTHKEHQTVAKHLLDVF